VDQPEGAAIAPSTSETDLNGRASVEAGTRRTVGEGKGKGKGKGHRGNGGNDDDNGGGDEDD
jgi:hypothetical protein